MSNIVVQVIRDRTRNRLTIAKDRVTLKLAKEASPELEAWLIEFSQRIAEEYQHRLNWTVRGPFSRIEGGRCTISLYSHDDQRREETFRSWELGMQDFKEAVQV